MLLFLYVYYNVAPCCHAIFTCDNRYCYSTS